MSKCEGAIAGTRTLPLRFALIWVSNLDNMQRLIEARRGLSPFRGVESEDRVERYVSHRGGMGVPRIQPQS